MRHKRNSGFTKSGGSKVDSFIAFVTKARPTLAIAFFTFMLVSMFAVKVAYSGQSCPNIQSSIKIINESGGSMSGTSLGTLSDSPFKRYVMTISRHVSAKIMKAEQCRGDAKKSPEVELFFVYRPLYAYTQSQIGPPFNLELTQTNGSRHLDSPWVKIASSRMPKPIVRAAFIWNERQILFDQVLMSGARASPTEPLLPIDEVTFEKMVQDYTETVVERPSNRFAALAIISKRLPTDIFWLFTHSWQSTRGPFGNSVGAALSITVKHTANEYTNLSKALINQFFSSTTNADLRYKSVLNLKDVFSLDNYRINKPLH
jgi:hypothetical protein